MEKRSLATSDAYFTKSNKAVWTSWDIDKSVKDGLSANPWMFRAITQISRSASTVPWVVFNAKMEPQWNHPLSKLFAKPNPQFTRQQMMELLITWTELTGTSFLKKVRVGNMSKELWPISPARIAPRPSNDPSKFIDGYRIRQDGGQEVDDPDYTPENVVYIRLMDPANPYKGLSPLAAAAKTVDLDNSQLDWNTGAMQNRAVVDGMFSFKRDLDQQQVKSITDRIVEKFTGKRGARKPLVVGSEASYQRMSLTPVELDFLESRKANREEILSVYGVPPQLVGIQDASTYNNFATSMRIFWETTLIPLLDVIKDAFNHSFADELQEGLTIGYDVSNVSALKDQQETKSKVAKTYTEMGVPVSVLNELLELGLKEYPGWDKPRAQSSTPPDPNAANQQDPNTRSFNLVPSEQRDVDAEITLRDKLIENKFTPELAALLAEQSAAVFEAIANNEDSVAVAKAFDTRLDELLLKWYTDIAMSLAKKVAKPSKRATWEELELRLDQSYSDTLKEAIVKALELESVILTDRSLIQETTVNYIIEQVTYGITNGLPVSAIQQALTDTGAFSPERALRIARTAGGTAASIGQMTAGVKAGATHKVWLTSKHETRAAHAAREGEACEVNKRFSVQVGTLGPRYPLDPGIAGADRINCRCFMRFEYRPGYKGG